MNLVVVAKHLRMEKSRIRHLYDRCHIPTLGLRCTTIKLLLKQLGSNSSDDSKIFKMFAVEQEIPTFTHGIEMVALRDEQRNWRILQDSAHQRTYNSLLVGIDYQADDSTSVFKRADCRTLSIPCELRKCSDKDGHCEDVDGMVNF